MRASYWTEIGAMALPLGVSLIALATVFSDWQDGLVIAGFVSIAIGCGSFIAGWVYMIQGERESAEKAKEERVQREKDEQRNQQEHDEIMAMLAGTLSGGKMSSPRILRFIERLREIEGKENDDKL